VNLKRSAIAECIKFWATARVAPTQPAGGPEEETRKFWRDNARAMLGESIGALEGAAKQIIVVTSLLEGIYFHAIAFSKIKSSLTILSGIIYLAPFLLWLISLLFALLVFLPRNYEVNINSFRNSK